MRKANDSEKTKQWSTLKTQMRLTNLVHPNKFSGIFKEKEQPPFKIQMSPNALMRNKQLAKTEHGSLSLKEEK